MLISTEILSTARFVGEEQAVRLVAEAGFDAYDFSMFDMARYDAQNKCARQNGHPLQSPEYAAFAKKVARTAKECGIVCNQAHAPFFPLLNREIMDYIKRALECAAIAGAKICVVHPDNNRTAEENAPFFEELLPIAKSFGVRIATENMWNWNKEKGEALPAACSHHEDFKKHVDLMADCDFAACLDIGHAEMRGLSTSAREMILTLGPRLQALHLHDNDRHHDSHALPFTMDIDFTDVIDALRTVGYQGDFTLEADQHLSEFTEDTLLTGLRQMRDAADRLRSMFLAR